MVCIFSGSLWLGIYINVHTTGLASDRELKQHGVKRVQLSAHARKSKLEKDRAKIAHYRALTKKVLDKKAEKVFTKEALQDTTVLLDLNPEFNAVWNYRRNIFNHLFAENVLDRCEALNTDLLVAMEMMKRFPKCYWIWNHRRWCLETLDETKNADWNRELAIVSKVLMMDSRNFHGWQYRRYVVSHLEQEARSKEPHSGTELEISLREFQYTTETINKSTANFSAWHNRTKLIAKILKLLSQENLVMATADEKVTGVFQSASKLLKHELNLVKTGMFMDAEDTSVWLYMQWLLTDKIFVGALPKDLYRELLQQQLKDVNELNDLEKDDTGRDNVWCLKTIIFLKTLLSRENNENDPSEHHIDNDVTAALNKLVELDPLRKGHYIDQLNGRAAIIC
ncbi:hypothetical protein OXX69_002040 [Metschnikowia pulcherrima]